MSANAVDVVVVGAGFGGLAILHRLRRDGLRVRVLEAASGVGGTWYWNTYPGARVDIESMEYSYPFPELQQEWSWPEKFSAQPDVERYLNWVADRLELRQDIELDCTVTAAHYDETANSWDVTAETAAGKVHYRAKYFVLATGFLTVPNRPDIPGLDDFAGQVAHTARWPQGGVEVEGKRVGVIGTAASGVQVIQTVAPKASKLTVFQRTANWSFPLNNVPMQEEYESWVKERYDHIREQEYGNRGTGTILVGNDIVLPNDRSALEVSEEERLADFNYRWDAGGPHLGRSFVDLISNPVANDLLREFWTEKILAVVEDPEVARKLVPTHPPLTRRPPGNTGYYETFNRDNVDLVDLKADPIDRVVENGIRLSSGAVHELDVLVLATGFDAGGGAAMQIDLVGRDGLSIQEHWKDGVRTVFGMLVHGFPNLFLVNGPQSPSTHFSPPLLCVYQADFLSRVIGHLDERSDAASIEAAWDAEEDWTEQVRSIYEQTLIPQTDSWWMGANIPGKPRRPVAWAGGFPEFKRQVEESLKDFDRYVIRDGAAQTAGGHGNA